MEGVRLAMSSPAVVSLAILKANADSLRKDYLENFVPFVAECLRTAEGDIVSTPDVQHRLRTQFGLNIPQSTITTLLSRLRKQGYVNADNGAYTRSLEKLNRLTFSDLQQQVMRMHATLIGSLQSFCQQRFHITWTPEEATAALDASLGDNELLTVKAATDEPVVHGPEQAGKGAKYIVGAFVQHLQETQSPDFAYLETVAIGNMLANAIFLPEPNVSLKHFRKTQVYFDTTFLIRALGYAGQARKDPCLELLHLLYEAGAQLYCFKHTLGEIRGALESCAHRLRERRLSDLFGPSFETVEHFLSNGYTASDVELHIVQLESDLASLKIHVIDTPSYVARYVVDEVRLGEVARQYVHYTREEPLDRDVKSIAAIMQLREGGESFDIERCRALFVTTNSSLARAALVFYSEFAIRSTISPCITDRALTVILWLKMPLKAPDLPRKRIIADCYAATQPSEGLYGRYIAEVDKLDRSNNDAASLYYALRYSPEAKAALMEATLGEEEAFTEGTVPEIIDHVRAQMQAEIRTQLEAEQQRNRDLEQALQEVKLARENDMKLSQVREFELYARLEAEGKVSAQTAAQQARDEADLSIQRQEDVRRSHIGATSKAWAHRLAWLLTWCAGGVLAAAAGCSILVPFVAHAPYFLAAVGPAVLVVASVLNLWFGTPVKHWIYKVECALQRRIRGWLLTLGGMDS